MKSGSLHMYPLGFWANAGGALVTLKNMQDLILHVGQCVSKSLASCNPKYEGGIEQSAPTDDAVC